MRCWIGFGTKVCVEMFSVQESEDFLCANAESTGENDLGGRQNEDSESRLTMRALGRSASSKIKQGWDWNR